MLKIVQNPPCWKCPRSEKHCSNCNRCYSDCSNKFQWTKINFIGNEYHFCSEGCGNNFFTETLYLREKF
ncbi:MAG: hypothetical protein I3274_05890 [Candidatus Moeniiplasma glomeromycotorum]|nr:hypothetical protein [Candidatus Moeniiplasma glomeromycotorum]